MQLLFVSRSRSKISGKHFPGAKTVLTLRVGVGGCVEPALGFTGGSDGKESVCNVGDLGSIPGSGRSPKKRRATHSSILAWRIPWTEEPGRLQPMRSQSWTLLSGFHFHGTEKGTIHHFQGFTLINNFQIIASLMSINLLNIDFIWWEINIHLMAWGPGWNRPRCKVDSLSFPLLWHWFWL